MAFTVRAAQPEDKAEWLRMRLALWPDEADSLAQGIDDFFARPDKSGAFVAERPNGGLGGFVEVGIRTYCEGGTTDHPGFIEGWYVDADLRRQGVGAALVAAAEDWARAQGCTEMGSDTWLDNQASIDAHARLGYAEVERLVAFYKPLPPRPGDA